MSYRLLLWVRCCVISASGALCLIMSYCRKKWAAEQCPLHIILIVLSCIKFNKQCLALFMYTCLTSLDLFGLGVSEVGTTHSLYRPTASETSYPHVEFGWFWVCQFNNHSHFMQQLARRAEVEKYAGFGFLSHAVFFFFSNSSHNSFCHVLCAQSSATPWKILRRFDLCRCSPKISQNRNFRPNIHTIFKFTIEDTLHC